MIVEKIRGTILEITFIKYIDMLKKLRAGKDLFEKPALRTHAIATVIN